MYLAHGQFYPLQNGGENGLKRGRQKRPLLRLNTNPILANPSKSKGRGRRDRRLLRRLLRRLPFCESVAAPRATCIRMRGVARPTQ